MKRLLVLASFALSGTVFAQSLHSVLLAAPGPAADGPGVLTMQQIMQYAVGNETRGGIGDSCAAADVSQAYKLDAYGAILQCDTTAGRWERVKLTNKQAYDLFLENAKWNDGVGGIPVY